MLTIHGVRWQHAQDLLRRWVFDWFEQLDDDNHIIAIPIRDTRSHITRLLQSDWVLPKNIVNLAGVMTTSVNGIANLHFLFGPNGQDNLSVATAWDASNPWKIILDNANNLSMRIIETTRLEHDKKMAVIQWLSHFLLVFIGWTNDEDIQKSLIIPWIAPEGTIQDMIFQNPFAEDIIAEFFDNLANNTYNPLTTFQHIVDSHLSPSDIDKFSTPNFRRIQHVISEWDIQIELPKQYVQDFRRFINSHWMQYISKQLQSIRPIQ